MIEAALSAACCAERRLDPPARPSRRSPKAQPSEQRAGPYKHLLTGVSYMLPIVVAGGLTIALSFVFGINAFKEEGTLPAALMSIGGGAAFAIMVPVLSGFIAYSIADRPGLAPGLIGGMLAVNLQAGFLGGIASGFLAGYVAKWLSDHIKLPVHFEGLKPVLVIPLLSTLVVGLLMVYVIGAPVRAIMEGLTAFLQGMGTHQCRAARPAARRHDGHRHGRTGQQGRLHLRRRAAHQRYVHADGGGDGGRHDAAARHLSLATLLGRNRFSRDEQEAGKAAGILGLSFITEGAIPFAAKDPLRVIPSMVLGSAVAGAISMYFGCGLRAPHGGVFVLAIPNAVSHLGWYAVAIVAGTLVTTAALLIVKRPLAEPKRARVVVSATG